MYVDKEKIYDTIMKNRIKKRLKKNKSYNNTTESQWLVKIDVKKRCSTF